MNAHTHLTNSYAPGNLNAIHSTLFYCFPSNLCQKTDIFIFHIPRLGTGDHPKPAQLAGCKTDDVP